MKRTLICLLLICLMCTTLFFSVSCGDDPLLEDTGDISTLPASDGKKQYLNVYNWGEYISDGSEGSYDTNAEFEAYCKEKLGLDVEVRYSTYPTNEDMYAKITSGAGSYDIIIPSDYMVERLVKEDLLEPFDPAKTVPNYAYIDDNYKGLYYDTENLYSVPYSYGVVGVIYNTTLVDEEDIDNSWGLLWNEKYKAKILQFNNPRDGFSTAMYYMGLDINSTDDAVWQKAFDKMVEQKPLVQGYVSDEIFDKMTSGSAAIATYYAGDYITMSADNEDLAFYYPKEGTNIFFDAMCIPKNAPNKALAVEYINFMLSKDAAIANAEYIGYASPNSLVYNDEEYREYMGEDAMEILYGTPFEEINANYLDAETGEVLSGYYRCFDEETQEKINDLWEQLKSTNAIEPWIHVVTVVIVVGLVVLGVVAIYNRKRRIRDYCTYAAGLKPKK